MKLRCIGLLLAIHLSADASPSIEPIVGLPCEGCQFVFVGMPVDIAAHSRIAPDSVAGERLHLQGRVLDVNGMPAPRVVVYAYHAYRNGGAPRQSRLSAYHGNLRGWAKADALGYYSFDTILPGIPANGLANGRIFMQVIEPTRCTYSIDPVLFSEDMRMTSAQQLAKQERGGSGVTSPVKDSAGVWQVTRDVQLGRNIPGYDRCSQPNDH